MVGTWPGSQPVSIFRGGGREVLTARLLMKEKPAFAPYLAFTTTSRLALWTPVWTR